MLFIHYYNHIKQNIKRMKTYATFVKINKTIKTLNLCNFIIHILFKIIKIEKRLEINFSLPFLHRTHLSNTWNQLSTFSNFDNQINNLQYTNPCSPGDCISVVIMFWYSQTLVRMLMCVTGITSIYAFITEVSTKRQQLPWYPNRRIVKSRWMPIVTNH